MSILSEIGAYIASKLDLKQDRNTPIDKANKLTTARTITLTGDVNFNEINYWQTQENEAIKVLNGETSIIIDNLVSSRNLGESSLELAEKILNKANAYRINHSVLLGTMQGYLKKIEKANSVEDLLLIKEEIN